MKIIRRSNFDIESVSDLLIAEKVHYLFVDELVNHLNDMNSGPSSAYIFYSKPDDYQLYIYNPV